MQVDRTIDSTTRLVTLTVIGDLGDDELLRLADLLTGGPKLDPGFSLLIDLRQANGQNVTPAGVHKLVVQPLVFDAASRRAVVVPSDLGFGMARMYEILRDGRGGGPRVFRDYDTARRWVTGNDDR
jgi:hypothetical protein